jgi:hypothetical protein
MTAAEIQIERRYRATERLGILTQGERNASATELEIAAREGCAFELDLERQELLERVVVTARVAQRDRSLERRFKK